MIGVRYVGFLGENSGFGQATRLHLSALQRAGVPVCGRSVLMGPDAPGDAPVPSRRYPRTARLCARQRPYDHVLLHVVPPGFSHFREPGCRHIGITVWDSTVLPPGWGDSLAQVDELWVPSRYAAIAYRRAAGPPVRLIPHPVRAHPRVRRPFPEIPDSLFLFLSIQEWSDRKNPLGLLRAFRDAFAGREEVGLLLKIGLRYVADLARVRRALEDVLRVRAGHPRPPPVYIIAEELTGRTLARLYGRADAFLSLHRSEGFGLCLAEAMAHGLPVVATGYSGNLDFMDAESAYLIDHKVVPVRVELGPRDLWTGAMEWAEPSHDHAVATLRAVVAGPERAARVAARGHARVLAELSPQRVGALMRQHLGS